MGSGSRRPSGKPPGWAQRVRRLWRHSQASPQNLTWSLFIWSLKVLCSCLATHPHTHTESDSLYKEGHIKEGRRQKFQQPEPFLIQNTLTLTSTLLNPLRAYVVARVRHAPVRYSTSRRGCVTLSV